MTKLPLGAIAVVWLAQPLHAQTQLLAPVCVGAPPPGQQLTYGFIERVAGGGGAGGPLSDWSAIYLSKKPQNPSAIKVYCKATDTAGRSEWTKGQKSFGLHMQAVGYTDNVGGEPPATGQRNVVDDPHRPADVAAKVEAVVWSDETHGKVFTIQVVAYLPEGGVIRTNLPGESIPVPAAKITHLKRRHTNDHHRPI